MRITTAMVDIEAQMAPDLPDQASLTWMSWLSFLRAYKVVTERIEQELAAAGQPTLVEYSLLFGLSHQAEYRLRQTDLANGVLISKSRVTRLMNTLERRGYVRRQKSQSDRRVTYTVLTERGRRAFEEATPIFAGAFWTHFASLIGSDSHGTLDSILRQIQMENVECPPGGWPESVTRENRAGER